MTMGLSQHLTALHMHEPLWLALAFTPWLVEKISRLAKGRQNRLGAFADTALLPWLIVRSHSTPTISYRFIVAAFWTSAAIATSGPYWGSKQAGVAEEAMDIAVVVDVSPSMGVTDVQPDRLETVRMFLKSFAGNLQHDRVSLIVFSAAAYSLMPLSLDRQMMTELIDQLDTNLVPIRGSNLSRGLELGIEQIKKTSRRNKALLLISDGESHTPGALAQVKRLKKNHIRLFVAGVGTKTGGPVADGTGHFLEHKGRLVISRLNQDRLTRMAKIAHGDYFHIQPGQFDAFLKRIFSYRNGTPAAAYQGDKTYLIYPWFLGLCLLILLWSGLRQIPVMLLLCALCFSAALIPRPVAAAPWTGWQAFQALNNGHFERAKKLYETMDNYNGWLGLGAAAYRQRNWQEALTAFQTAQLLAKTADERARASYNAGNALARLRHWQAAARAYEKALALRANLNHAAFNLQLVNKQLGVERQHERQNRAVPPDTLPNRVGRNAMTDRPGNEPGSSQPFQHKSTTPQDSQSINHLLRVWGLGSSTDNMTLQAPLKQLEALREPSSALIQARILQQLGGRSKTPVEKPW